MAREEYLFKLSVLEQEIMKLEQQMQVIQQQVLELQTLKLGLEELKKSKEKQMLANLGKNIFIKTEIQDKKLLVDIGNKTFIKKDIAETLKVVDEQLDKLIKAKGEVVNKMREIQMQTEQVILEAEKSEKEKK